MSAPAVGSPVREGPLLDEGKPRRALKHFQV